MLGVDLLKKRDCVFLPSESPELIRAWSVLVDPIANNKGELWQYMGTWTDEKGGYYHQFRHRNHPETDDRVLVNVLATKRWTAERKGIVMMARAIQMAMENKYWQEVNVGTEACPDKRITWAGNDELFHQLRALADYTDNILKNHGYKVGNGE